MDDGKKLTILIKTVCSRLPTVFQKLQKIVIFVYNIDGSQIYSLNRAILSSANTAICME